MARRLVLIVVALLASACPAPKDEVVIFAASSLQDAFSSLAQTFRATHPGVTVTLNFAGSQELRTQLEHGARADVFASADLVQMRALEASGHVEPSIVFARNELVFVVSSEAAAGVKRAEDLATLDRVSLGAEASPIGRYTATMFERTRRTRLGPGFADAIVSHVVSRELSARQVLARVSLGEASAGVVYRTDAMSPKTRLQVIALPDEARVVAEYPIAIVAHAPHAALARSWIEFVQSSEGRAVLEHGGFDVGPAR